MSFCEKCYKQLSEKYKYDGVNIQPIKIFLCENYDCDDYKRICEKCNHDLIWEEVARKCYGGLACFPGGEKCENCENKIIDNYIICTNQRCGNLVEKFETPLTTFVKF